jgi:GntR family transcriptional regulator / MocR family aminotransferase
MSPRRLKSSTGQVNGIAPTLMLEKSSGIPLHKQIYSGFRAAILRGELVPGQQVPSSRALTVELGVSRFPILEAYAQLHAEGYFETQAGLGTFISRLLPVSNASSSPRIACIVGSRLASKQSERLPAFEETPWRYGQGAFALHQPALDQFPFRTWSQLVALHSRRPRADAFHHVDPLGLGRFRTAICSYLRTSRAVRCEPDQIMIVSGSQQALALTSRVLFDPEDPVLVEDPGYPLMRSVLLGAGCRLVPVPVDENGMNVSAAIELCEKARAAFVTPSHQFPMGSTLSASRRLQLIEWAERSGSWIVEDDYDSEFRYESKPISSLQGLDISERVIYIGTFSKVLFASLRLGYIVIPKDLVERFIRVRLAMDIFPPYLYQEVLADFMERGSFIRHLRGMRALYQKRRATLVDSLEKRFGDDLAIHGAAAGLHLCVTLPKGFHDLEVAAKAAEQHLWIWPLSSCYLECAPQQGMLLGYGNTPVEQVAKGVKQLQSVLSRCHA